MAYTRTVKFSYYTVCMMEDEQDVSPKDLILKLG